MNEKYIQAIILGSIIGSAILLDDFISPKPSHTMMQKHLIMKDGDFTNHPGKEFRWKEKPGIRKDLHEIEDHNVMIFESHGSDQRTIEIEIDSDSPSEIHYKILEDVDKHLSKEDRAIIKEKLESLKKEIVNETD